MLAHSMTQTFGATDGLLEKAARFAGRPRERLLAMVDAEELCYLAQPQIRGRFCTARVVPEAEPATGVDARTSSSAGGHVTEILIDLILDAVRCGDLRFPRAKRPEELAFAVCVLAFGLRALVDTTVAAGRLTVPEGADCVRQALDTVLDTLAWQPLSTEWDYGGTRERIRRELGDGA